MKEKQEAPRSYNIVTESGKELRRNRAHLQKSAEPVPEVIPDTDYESLFSKEQIVKDDTLKKPARFRRLNVI